MSLNDMPPRSGPPFPKDRWRPDTGWQTRWATSAPSGSCRLHARTTLGRGRAAVEHPNAELESLRPQSDPDSADSGRWRRESEGGAAWLDPRSTSQRHSPTTTLAQCHRGVHWESSAAPEGTDLSSDRHSRGWPAPEPARGSATYRASGRARIGAPSATNEVIWWASGTSPAESGTATRNPSHQ